MHSMFIILFVSCLTHFSVGSPFAPPHLRSCPVCEPEFCPKVAADCAAGVVADDCGCCAVGLCLLAPGLRCLDPDIERHISATDLGKYGSCGPKMSCNRRTDLEPDSPPEAICSCLDSQQVCGTDNKTYDGICHLDFVDANIKLAHKGPCEAPPQVVAGPQDVSVIQGSPMALDCEVQGFPVPSVTWEFLGYNGLASILPGDDSSIVVQTRGGPEDTMLTSWVQIMSTESKDAGTYVCVASNSYGSARAHATLNVHVYPAPPHYQPM